MNLDYLEILKRKARTIALIICLVIVLGLVITVAQPFKYRSTIQVLVIEHQLNLDAYTAIRAAERMNNNLSHIIYTNSFMDKVLQAGFNVQDNLPSDSLARKKAWGKTIQTYVVPETGILKVDVYHPSRKQAEAMAHSIAYVLATAGSEYIGSQSVTIKTIDQPITSLRPVKPNIALNLMASLALGILIAMGYVLLRFKEEDLAEVKAQEKVKVDWQEEREKIPVAVETGVSLEEVEES